MSDDFEGKVSKFTAVLSNPISLDEYARLYEYLEEIFYDDHDQNINVNDHTSSSSLSQEMNSNYLAEKVCIVLKEVGVPKEERDVWEGVVRENLVPAIWRLKGTSTIQNYAAVLKKGLR